MDFRLIARNLLLFVSFVLLSNEWGFGLPIFARRYQTSCTTCHSVPPKLNPIGIAFRNNGYRIPLNDEKFVKDNDVSLGAPAWKKLWPKAVWPGAIPGLPPIAIRARMDANIRPSQPVNLNFDFPSSLTLLFAGPAGDTFSFFGSVVLLGATNTFVIDRAYGQFKLMPERPGSNWLTLKVGRIETRAEPFSTTFRRTTGALFNASDYRAVQNGYAIRDHDAGVELWGAATGPGNRGGVEYAVGVVQGTAGRPENNNSKDYYWNASYKLGGHGVVGSREEETVNLDRTESYSETSLSIGAFGYRGRGPSQIANGPEDRFKRDGVKFDAYLGKLNVFGTAVSGRDVFRSASERPVETSAMFAEADYMLLPWVMPVVRFEKTNFSDRRDVNQWVAAVNFLVRANVRVIAEEHFYNRLETGRAARTGINEGLIRFEFLF